MIVLDEFDPDVIAFKLGIGEVGIGWPAQKV